MSGNDDVVTICFSFDMVNAYRERVTEHDALLARHAAVWAEEKDLRRQINDSGARADIARTAMWNAFVAAIPRCVVPERP